MDILSETYVGPDRRVEDKVYQGIDRRVAIIIVYGADGEKTKELGQLVDVMV